MELALKILGIAAVTIMCIIWLMILSVSEADLMIGRKNDDSKDALKAGYKDVFVVMLPGLALVAILGSAIKFGIISIETLEKTICFISYVISYVLVAYIFYVAIWIAYDCFKKRKIKNK